MKFFMLFTLAVQSILACPIMGVVKTSDGVSLSYNQVGPHNGSNIVLIPGWRQSAAEWHKQVDYFSEAGFRVTTYDMRGHGESAKPSFGYRVSRFAADLNDVLTQLDLKDVTIISHSMGCSVTWSFWDLYPQARKLVRKLVLVDQSAHIAIDPTWPEGKAAELAAIFPPNTVYETVADLSNQLEPLVRSMFTDSVSDEDFDFVLAENKKISDANAGAILIDHSFQDWRDVLPRITVPTLVLGGELSIFSAAGTQWVADQIPGSQSYTFTAAEKGSHFFFWENAPKFNSIVERFITDKKV